MTEVRVLGPVEVIGPSGAIDIGGRTSRAIVAVLALARGRVISADALLDAVWGDEPPASGVRTVHAAVSRLRAALIRGGADGVLEGTGSGYRLVGVDVDAEAAQATGDPDLWRGPALGEFADLPVLAAEGVRLHELHMSLRERRIDAQIASGNVTEAIGELETLLSADSLREALWERLMLALHRAGRQADALRAFQRCRAALAEAGVEPGPGISDLESKIATRRLDTPPNTPAPASTVIVGDVRTAIRTTQVIVGADPTADVVVDDPAVSGIHARLQWVGSAWVLTDLGSSNGTWVNGARLTSDRAIRPGDDIRIGFTRLAIEMPATPKRATMVLSAPPELSDVEHQVLTALCRPLIARDLLEPRASLAQVAAEVGLDEEAVVDHLHALAERFGVPADDWDTLARAAVAAGAVVP